MASYPIPPWLHGVSAGELGSLAASAARSSAELQMQRQRMAQEMQMSEMEMAAKQAAQERQEMRASQEMEVEKAYRDAQLGLRQRELDQEQQRIEFQVQSAARKAQVQAEATRRIQRGEDPTKVWMELGPQAGLTSPALAALSRKTESFGGAMPVPGLPENFKAVQTGPGSRQIIRVPPPAQTGPVKTVPVLDPSGNPIAGAYGVPTLTGGVNVRHVPTKSDYETLMDRVQQRKAALGKTTTGTTKKIPQDAIDHLKQNPELAPQFDEKYGTGEAEKILGTEPEPAFEDTE